jgi:hypothetical protein
MNSFIITIIKNYIFYDMKIMIILSFRLSKRLYHIIFNISNYNIKIYHNTNLININGISFGLSKNLSKKYPKM